MLQTKEEKQKYKPIGLFYDPYATYEDNYKNGPPVIDKINNRGHKIRTSKFLGFEINLPFGIPAGPLLNSKYIKKAFELGFDVSTYKTVRSHEYPCHPYPNILPVNSKKDLHPDITPRLITKKTFSKNLDSLNITNSFGVPSKKSKIWQKDVKKALKFEKKGQLLILSFMGTITEGLSAKDFTKDFALAGKLASETKVKAIEANLSCPNIGNEGLVCYNTTATEEICRAIRREVGASIPLILKIGYFNNKTDLEKIAKIANKYAQAIATINTLQVEVVDSRSRPALPGPNRIKSGICGASIKWAGIEMVKNLYSIKKKHKYDYEIVGVGGVMNPNDYFEYKNAGADLVQSATGAMWRPSLANDILLKIRK